MLCVALASGRWAYRGAAAAAAVPTHGEEDPSGRVQLGLESSKAGEVMMESADGRQSIVSGRRVCM